MTADRARDDAGEPRDGPPGSPLPWWTGRQLRLPLLLACLALASVALITREHLLFAAGASHGGTNSVVCLPPTPPILDVSWGELKHLHTGLLAVMAPVAPYRYAYGSVTPTDAWLDNPPRRIGSSQLPNGLVPASFEMRSWARDPRLATPGDDVVADVFMFAGPGRARRFFAEASSVHCHRDGLAQSASLPPRARDLTWINPDGVREEDAFLVRGQDVFRIGIVLPGYGHSTTATGISTANTLACALPDADCPRSTSSPIRRALNGHP